MGAEDSVKGYEKEIQFTSKSTVMELTEAMESTCMVTVEMNALWEISDI